MNETKPGRVCPNCGRVEAEPAPRICANCGANLPQNLDAPAPPPVLNAPPPQQPWAMTPTAPMSQQQRDRSESAKKTTRWVLGCFLFFGAVVFLGLLAICGVIPTP